MSKCSVTLASVAARPPGARQGFGGLNYPRHSRRWQCYTPPPPRAKISATGRGGPGWGATGPFARGVAATPLQQCLGSDFGRTDFSRIFVFGPPDFFADFFCRRIFSPHFCGKKCPEKSSRKIPGKILQNLYNKNPPTHFCRLPRATTHSKLRKEPQRGCSYIWSATWRGCSVCAT